MIREQRDLNFWRWVTEAPEVRSGALLAPEAVLDKLILDPAVVPLAAKNGGFLFLQRDGLGRTFELHTLFRREGWGREAVFAGVEALELMFGRGMDLLFTFSAADNLRARPPRKLGFAAAGDPAPALGRQMQTWTLTRADWRQRKDE